MILCDTNIAIYLLHNESYAVRVIEEIGEQNIAYSIISMVEAISIRDAVKANWRNNFLNVRKSIHYIKV